MTRSRLAGLGELMLPGAGIGAAAGIFAGLMTMIAGLPFSLALVNAIALAVPMGLFGGLYTVLCARGVLPVGVFAPVALFWLVAFPVSRLIQELSAGVHLTGGPGLSTDLWSFLAYNALLAPGLAFGFIWLHERVAPLWIFRIREHNPWAEGLARAYLTYAERVYAQKERQKARREFKRKSEASA